MHTDFQATLVRFLKYHNACTEALTWVQHSPKATITPKRVWKTCPDGEWLLWLLSWAPRSVVTDLTPALARITDRIAQRIQHPIVTYPAPRRKPPSRRYPYRYLMRLWAASIAAKEVVRKRAAEQSEDPSLAETAERALQADDIRAEIPELHYWKEILNVE